MDGLESDSVDKKLSVFVDYFSVQDPSIDLVDQDIVAFLEDRG